MIRQYVYGSLRGDDPTKQHAYFAILHGHTAPVWSVAFSPDGSMFATAVKIKRFVYGEVLDGSSLFC